MKKCQVKECPHWEQNRGQPCLCLSGKPKFRTTEGGGWNTWVRMAERHTESGTCCEVSGTLKVSPQLMTRRSWEDSALVQQLSVATCNDYLKVGSLNCCKLRPAQHRSRDRLQIILETRAKARLEQGCSPQRQLSLAFLGVGGGTPLQSSPLWSKPSFSYKVLWLVLRGPCDRGLVSSEAM